jgi:hypothetical protein
MTQLELFTPSPLIYALSANLTQLRHADELLYFQTRVVRERVRADVARATFCAKVEGFEFSRYPRR